MIQNESLTDLNLLVWTSLLAALVAVGAYIQIPIPVGSVPFSMQPLFVFMAGLILGPVRGGIAMALYLLAGLAGLPVFSGGKSGLAHLLGPSGGYLIGFIFMAVITGLATAKTNARFRWFSGLFFGFLGLLALYAPGVAWLKFSIKVDWSKALAIGLITFFPLDLIKLVLAVCIYRYLKNKRLLPR